MSPTIPRAGRARWWGARSTRAKLPPQFGVLSFTIDGVHPHDIGTIMDREGGTLVLFGPMRPPHDLVHAAARLGVPHGYVPQQRVAVVVRNHGSVLTLKLPRSDARAGVIHPVAAHAPGAARTAVLRSMPLLREASDNMLPRGGCVACHAQPMTVPVAVTFLLLLVADHEIRAFWSSWTKR